MASALTTSAFLTPTIPLTISKEDGERFHAASDLVSKNLEELERSKCPDVVSSNAAGEATKETTANASHDGNRSDSRKHLLDLLDDTVRSSQNSFLSSFLRHLGSSRLCSEERRLSLLLFANMTKSAKLKLMFDTLATDRAACLSREQLISLFRIILTSISCCVPTPQSDRMSTKPSPRNSPDNHCQDLKRSKLETREEMHPEEQAEEDVVAACSFDSAATLKDEDDAWALLQRDIQEVAVSATNSVFKYAKEQCKDTTSLSFAIFGEWYSTDEAKEIAGWLELLHKSKWLKQPKRDAADQLIPRKLEQDPSQQGQVKSNTSCGNGRLPMTAQTLISFDFSGSGAPQPLVICITDENIQALRHMVYRTGMIYCQVAKMCKMLLQQASRPPSSERPAKLVMNRTAFRDTIYRFLIPEHAMRQCSYAEQQSFITALMDIFTCLEGARPDLSSDEADLQELATAVCFFCAGSKSTKLSTAFELFDHQRLGYLTQSQLLRYLRSHLIALTTLAYLQPVSSLNKQSITPERARKLRDSVQSGAKWTLSHFFDYLGTPDPSGIQDQFSFESFASWYCSGGYNVAPWLELLDLNKVLALLCDSQAVSPVPQITQSIGATQPYARPPPNSRPIQRDRMSSLRRHHAVRRVVPGPPSEILFSFPMAGGKSLIVLKDDALYVREVVESLCLLSANPHKTWNDLFNCVMKRRMPQKDENAIYVNQATFVESLKEAIPASNRKRRLGESGSTHSVTEVLSNFFQCFDIEQADHVALDELMGGLSLLCGGKKSLKLAFAFGIFDTRPGMNRKKPGEGVIHSLSGEDLFLFLRSVLIVLFSCCRQSLDMSDDVVSRCICDTANLICNDVMRHQWETKQLDRLNFDDFGQWYNDGGFERAPWLELLDLKKWVLVDDFETLPKQAPGDAMRRPLTSPRRALPPASLSPKASPQTEAQLHIGQGLSIPPPPEEELDDSFFDENHIMGMDSMDDMDIFLSSDAEHTDQALKIASSFSVSPKHSKRQTPIPAMARFNSQPPLKVHIVTSDKSDGYNIIFSCRRLAHLRRVLQESGLLDYGAESICVGIVSRASDSRDLGPRISKHGFDAAMSSFLKWKASESSEEKRCMTGLFNALFACFDREASSKPSGLEVACGLSIFCQGKKSDKLEYAFDFLDQKKRGKLSKKEMNKYFHSFLTVLFGISVCPTLESDSSVDSLQTYNGDLVDRSPASVARAAKAGAEYATSLIFRELEKPSNSFVTFDEFAAWYTSKGHSSIPWLELIDLRKWVLQE